MLLLLPFGAMQGQVVAQDFTLDDCNGNSHHLFSELDAGKVIILEFAMVPACAPCIDAGNAIQAVMGEYEISNPGMVKWYTWGYNDVYSCDDMLLWETAHALAPSASFINGTDIVAYYGGMSMPTIVVLGSDHLVYLIQQGFIPSTQSHVESSVQFALSVGIGELEPQDNVVFPNPVVDRIQFGSMYTSSKVIDLFGRVVLDAFMGGSASLDVSALPGGTYILQTVTGSGEVWNRRFVKR